MEPEACIPLAGLISKETLLTRGQIVLAGDHLQLGPVLRYEGYMVKLVGRAAGRKNVTRETNSVLDPDQDPVGSAFIWIRGFIGIK